MAATVEGVFRIIDRASPAMRGMERQAIKTDLAIQKLGATLDTIGSRRQLRNIETATRDVRTFGNEVENVDRRSTRASRSLGNVEQQTRRVGNAFRSAGSSARGFHRWMRPALFLGIATAIGVVVQGVGALAGGLVALTPRLADAVGLLAPAAAGFTGLGLAMVTVKLATNDLSKAYGGNKKALKSLTPEARSFLTHLKAYHPVIQQLRRSAQGGLFAGLDYSLARLQRGVPTLDRLLTMMSGRLGRLSKNASNQLTTSSALGDFELLGNQGGRIVTTMGRGILDLVAALRSFAVAAIPFTDWLNTSIGLWLRNRRQIAEFNRDSGKTAAFLDRARVSLTNFWHIGQNLWKTMRNIGQAARPLGDELWTSAERTTKAWAESTDTIGGRTGLTKQLLNMRNAIREITGLVGDLGRAIFRMGADPGLPNTVAALRGLVPSLERVLNVLANNFGPPLARILSEIGDTASYLADGTGPFVLMADLLGQMLGFINGIASAVPGMGRAISLALDVFLIQRFLSKLGLLRAGWLGVAGAANQAAAAEARAAGAGMLGGRFGGITSGFQYGFGSGRRGGRLVGSFGLAARAGNVLGRSRVGGAIARLGGMGRVGGGIGLAAGLGGLALSSAVGGRAGAIGGGMATGAAIGSLLGPWGALAGAGVGGLIGGLRFNDSAARVAGIDKQLRRDLETWGGDNPSSMTASLAQIQILQAAQARLASDQSQAAQAELAAIRQEIQARQSVVSQLRAEDAQRRRAAAVGRARGIAADLGHVFDMLVRGGSSKTSAAGVVNRNAIAQLRTMTDPKARFALASGLLNWERGVLGAKSSTFTGLRHTLAGLVPGLIAPGNPGSVATGDRAAIDSILARMNPSAGRGGYAEQLRQRRSKAPTPLQGALIAELVAAGIPGPDARELVMSADASGMGPRVGRTPRQRFFDSLPAVQFGRRSLTAQGDRLRQLYENLGNGTGIRIQGTGGPSSSTGSGGGGTSAVAADASRIMGRFPGLSVTSAYRPGDPGYHGRNQARDLGGGSSTMNAAARWIMQSGMYRFLAEGIHNPGLSVKNGRVVPPSFWGSQTWNEHRDHIHIAATRQAPFSALGVLTGVPGAGMQNPLSVGAGNLSGLYGHAAVQAAAARAVQGFATFSRGAAGAKLPGVSTVTATSLPKGGVYSKRQLMSLASSVGFPDPNMAAAVALAESSGRVNASHVNSDGSIDRGLWEINSIHGPLSVFDPLANAQAAYKISSGGRNWNPWTTFKTGAYRKFLQAGGPRGGIRYAGAFKDGGRFTTSGPTMFLAGDNPGGRETVTVTKGGGGLPGSVTITNLNVHYNGPGDVTEAIVEEVEKAFELLTSELSLTGTQGARD